MVVLAFQTQCAGHIDSSTLARGIEDSVNVLATNLQLLVLFAE